MVLRVPYSIQDKRDFIGYKKGTPELPLQFIHTVHAVLLKGTYS